MDAQGQFQQQHELAERFETHRSHLRAVAYRMLGSLSEADDAVQESWLRLSRSGGREIHNLGGWLTTVVARVCLDTLRTRTSRREEPFSSRLPDPIVSHADGTDPEAEALLIDSVGVALLVVLDTLAPAERLAFVLHDVFGVPFDEIADMVERSPEAARQLASRARRRVREMATAPKVDLHRQRKVVDAFLAAARDGDFEALLQVLDADVVLRADSGAELGASRQIRGATAVAKGARAASRPDLTAVPVRVNGAAGIIGCLGGRPISVMAFTVAHGKISRIDVLTDPVRLRQLNLARFVA